MSSGLNEGNHTSCTTQSNDKQGETKGKRPESAIVKQITQGVRASGCRIQAVQNAQLCIASQASPFTGARNHLVRHRFRGRLDQVVRLNPVLCHNGRNRLFSKISFNSHWT
jgi:hypothetical protein